MYQPPYYAFSFNGCNADVEGRRCEGKGSDTAVRRPALRFLSWTLPEATFVALVRVSNIRMTNGFGHVPDIAV